MLDQTPPQDLSKPQKPPKIKKQGDLVISTADDGTVTYYPKKFYEKGIGFDTAEQARLAQNMTMQSAMDLAAGKKSFITQEATPPATPDPAKPAEVEPAKPVAEPAIKPDWVIRREKMGIPYAWNAKLRAWQPANGQRISV
jgi:hypothetical protein